MPTLRLLLSNDQDYRPLLENARLKPRLAVLGDLTLLPLADLDSPADIWLGEPSLSAERLKTGDKPRWLQSVYAGVDVFTQLDPSQRPAYLSRMTRIFGQMMAEYVFAHVLGIYQQLPAYRAQAQRGYWKRVLPYRSPKGDTFLMLGTGEIGLHLAKVARLLGMRTVGVNRKGYCPEAFDAVYPLEKLPEALQEADVVVNALPATPQTMNAFNASLIACLKDDAIFVNIGRGNFVVEADLMAWLKSHPKAHAVLDVFQTEPLPADHPFWSMPNVTVTPHSAGQSVPEQVLEVFAMNYVAYCAGKPLEGLVDWEAGY